MSTMAVGSAALVLAATGIAVAQSGKGKITAGPGLEIRREALKITRAFAGPREARSAAFAARPPYGRVAGISTKRLAGFPLEGSAFALLSTGNVLSADDRNTRGDVGVNAGGPVIRGARDVTIYRVNLTVPRNRNCLSFRFKFLTEEFPEFVNEEFNDGFIAEVDRTTWDTTPRDSNNPTINAPDNFAADADGNLISVNSVGDTSLTASRAKGTTYDGATRRLRASTRITPGRHRLYLSLFDQGDRQFDSAVFVDKLTYTRTGSCDSGAVIDN